MLKAFFSIRYMTVLVVIATLLGSLLLFLLGGLNTLQAFALFLGLKAPSSSSGSAGHEAVVAIVESLDNFLLGFALIYMSYSTYYLFVYREQEEEKRIPMPEWMKVEDLGQMKRVLLEVIMVLLTVFLLKLVLVESETLEWNVLILPASIVAIAISLKLVNFD